MDSVAFKKAFRKSDGLRHFAYKKDERAQGAQAYRWFPIDWCRQKIND
ncbi:hypothetical protein ACN9M1_25070 [Ralstonia sp. R-29]